MCRLTLTDPRTAVLAGLAAPVDSGEGVVARYRRRLARWLSVPLDAANTGSGGRWGVSPQLQPVHSRPDGGRGAARWLSWQRLDRLREMVAGGTWLLLAVLGVGGGMAVWGGELLGGTVLMGFPLLVSLAARGALGVVLAADER